MNVAMVLDMAVAGAGDRVAFTGGGRRLTYGELADRAVAGAARIRESGATHVLYAATSTPVFPVALFAAAFAGVPFVPLNYRLGEQQLVELVARHQPALVVGEEGWRGALGDVAATFRSDDEWWDDTVADAGSGAGAAWPDDQDAVALLLYTSGTTSAPKAAILRHRHLLAYLFGTVEFGAAAEDEASLVSVPPYHIAGVSNALSNVYAGRRVVYLPTFTPADWLDAVRAESVTHALVVPTMLARVVEHLGPDANDAAVPSLRSLAYGGARMPVTVLERALELFPGVDFVNAYGLTETSSTIAVLGPDDHRAALASGDPAARARLGSAGRIVPGVEIEVRDAAGSVLPPGEPGDIFVRGEQVSGEYVGAEAPAEGWLATRDRGWVDVEGYLFIEGRTDDTIIRGGENIAPAEIEDALLRHPAVAEAAVVGVPDEEWGQRIAAVVVAREGSSADPDELREFVRGELRSSKTPDHVEVWDELPYTDSGKLLRRVVLDDVVAHLAT